MSKKSELLKEFVQKANERNDRNLSPTSESMLKTLEIIGDQEQTKKSFHNEIMYDSSLKFIVGKKPCARDAHSSLIFK
jgi:methanogenic corrinoid protein MtbC1